MNNLLKKTRDFILAQQSGIISSTILISSMLIVARIFGFLRYRILNSYFTTSELDIFYAAFRIPDFVFEILITGALTTTFIPFYLKYSKDVKRQNIITSSVINLITIALVIFILILYIAMPYLVRIVTPGFAAYPEKLTQAIALSRMLLLGQLPFLVLGNFLTGISQAHKSFFIPSLAPVLYNVSIVLVTVAFGPTVGISATVWGVIAGAVVFLLIQTLILFKIEFSYAPTIQYLREMKDFLAMIVPRVLTVFAAQIESTIELTLASLLSHGSYTIFYLAQHLQLLPVSIVGMAFGQASLPYISELYQNKKIEELKKIIVDSIINLFFITIPFAGFFIVNRTPLVRLVYGGSKFDWDATVMTAMTMSFFCISLPFHSVYYFLTRCFYAALDSKTPFVVSVIAIIANAASSWVAIVVFKQPVWILGLTFSATITIQVIVLFLLYSIRIHQLSIMTIVKELLKTGIAGLLATIITFDARRILDGLIFDTTRTINLFFLMVVCFLIMITTYLFACWTLDARALYLVSRGVRKARQVREKITEIFIGVES